MMSLSLFKTLAVMAPIVLSLLLWPYFKSARERALLIATVFLVLLCLEIVIVKIENSRSIQGFAKEKVSEEKKGAGDVNPLIDLAKDFLGIQTPTRIAEMPEMFSDDGTFAFWFVANHVERRRVFGRKYLIDLRSEKDKNRASIFLETLRDSNFLVFEIFTYEGSKYSERVNIDHWRDGKAYHIAYTWSNSAREIKLYLEGQMKVMIKTEGKIFEKSGVKALFY